MLTVSECHVALFQAIVLVLFPLLVVYIGYRFVKKCGKGEIENE